jgi:prepilin peptidase CpaA
VGCRIEEVEPVITIVALGFMTAAAISDLRQRRISNRLNVSAAAAALVLQLVVHGWSGVLVGIQGLLVGLAVLFLPFAAGMIGGGDVKFVAAMGAFFGWRLMLAGLIAGVVLGGIVGAVTLVRRGRFRQAMQGLMADLVCLSSGVKPTTLKTTEGHETVPYGVLLAMGMAGCLVVALFEEVPWVSQ